MQLSLLEWWVGAIWPGICVVLMGVGIWVGRRWERGLLKDRVNELVRTVEQERLARTNQLRDRGRLFEPHADNGPPSRNLRIRVSGTSPGQADKPPTRM